MLVLDGGYVETALSAVGRLLRLGGKLDYGLWCDEIQTLVEHVRRPLDSIVTTLGSDNNHPLYTVSAWLSMLKRLRTWTSPLHKLYWHQ